MKEYTFTVRVQEQPTTFSFIEDIESEISSEKYQLDLTHSINSATSEVLKQVLRDFVKPINKELEKVGLMFTMFTGEPYAVAREVNKYQDHYFILNLPKVRRAFVIGIFGISDEGFTESKYTTYTGDFEIRMRLNSTTGYTTRQKENMIRVNSVEDVFTLIRGQVKEEMILQSK